MREGEQGMEHGPHLTRSKKNLLVESARSQQRSVKQVRSVRRSNHKDPAACPLSLFLPIHVIIISVDGSTCGQMAKAVHFDQQLRHHSIQHPASSAPRRLAPRRGQRIQFIEEQHARLLATGLLEQGAHLSLGLPYVHVEQLWALYVYAFAYREKQGSRQHWHEIVERHNMQ